MNLTAAFDASLQLFFFCCSFFLVFHVQERHIVLRKELRAAVFAPRHNLSVFQTSVRVMDFFLIPSLARYSSGSQYDHLSML